MGLDAGRLSEALGVDPALVADAQRLEPGFLFDQVGVIAADTAHTQEPAVVLGFERAAAAFRALQETDWTRFDDQDRARAAVYLLGVLAGLGVNPYGEGQQ